MYAAATATSSRNGMLIRVSEIVSSSLPGSAANAPAYSCASGFAKMIPSKTSTPVTRMRPFTTCDPNRHAAAFPSVLRYRVTVGTNAALIAPSANRSRSSVGMRVATTNASFSRLVPK
jgi:hypothetical protein